MSAKGASCARSSAMRPSTRLLRCWLWVLTGSSFTKREKRQLSAKPTQGSFCSYGCEKAPWRRRRGAFSLKGRGSVMNDDIMRSIQEVAEAMAHVNQAFNDY